MNHAGAGVDPKFSADDAVPLSYAQQRLWFLHQLQPELAVYNIPLAIELDGCLDASILRLALEGVVQRHEVLRTVYRMQEGAPVQHVLEQASCSLPVVDLAPPSAGKTPPGALQQQLDQEVRRPFDVGRDVMLRTKLFRLDERRHVLSLVMHHLAADGWSLNILFREISALYTAISEGRKSGLEELAIQYADFAVWQRQCLTDAALAAELKYWEHQLAGAPPVLELATDRPRPSQLTYRGNTCRIDLSRALCQRLRAFSRQENVTLFNTLLAVFKVLLHRYTNQDEIIVGAPVAGRHNPEVEGLIGLFVNTLVLRSGISDEPTFRELLRRVHATTLAAQEHQQLPLEKLVQHLQPQRDPSRTPLFQVMFSLQNTPRCELQLGQVKATRIDVSTKTAKCDLTLSVIDMEEDLQARLTYNADLFDQATMARLANHWRNLLEAAIREPDRPISDLPLMDAEEQGRIVNRWNDTSRRFPRDRGLPELFEEQVEKSPSSVAAAFAGQQLTYGELNRRANQLARCLQLEGVTRATPVAVCLPRSLDLLVAFLAVLKAGGVYVPLDPSYPEDRLKFMLQDCRAAVVLTGTDEVEFLSKGVHKPIVLPRARQAIAVQSESNLECRLEGTDLAYLMYTSGSTGRPKGTAIPQRAISRLVLNTDYVPLTPADIVAQASNCSFDAATFEIWGALLNGARLEIMPQETLVTAAALAAEIRQKKITTLFVTTALLNQLVEQDPAVFAGLTHLLFGGEAVTPHYVRKLLAHSPPRRVLHVYGPTETTTFATWYPVQEVAEQATTIPIGRPIANTTTFLLDPQRRPVPIGVPGEVYIGGDGVAAGYWNRPELTEQRFVEDPFALDNAARLYRTGDLARWLPDGSLEFVGRVDGQVKVRGFRIEPGEIEHQLKSHPAVAKAVVVSRNDRCRGRYLAAYLVAGEASLPTTAELREFLGRSLPDYMIPTAFVSLSALPLSPNGKIDRAALPDPAQACLEMGQSYVAPRNLREDKLAQIWANTMNVERVGIHDNFFDLGGHSLLAVKMLAEVEKQFEVRLPLATMFSTPTIATLASLVQDDGREVTRSRIVPIQPRGAQSPFFSMHAGGGHTMFYRDVAMATGLDQPFFGVRQLREPGELPLRTVEDMVTTYLPEIRKQQPHGPYYLGGYSSGGLLALEAARQLVNLGEQIAMLAIFDTILPHRIQRSRSALRRTWRKIERQRQHWQRPLYESVHHLCRKRGWRVPSHFSHFCLREANRVAAESYVPQPFAGRITFFRATKSRIDSADGWEEIAQGGLEIHDVPTAHGDMFVKNTGPLVAEFQACLRRAQAASSEITVVDSAVTGLPNARAA